MELDMTAKKKKRKTKPRPRKATSDRVSSIAGRWLAYLGRVSGSRAVGHYKKRAFGSLLGELGTVAELRAILGSALGQDETKGRREGRVRR
jgi:hypothetical protein